MSDEKAAAPAESAAPASGGSSKIVLILTGVNTLAMVAVVAIAMISFNKQKAKDSVSDIQPNAEEHAEAPAGDGHGGGAHGGGEGGHGAASGKKSVVAGDVGKMISMDQFTINLATPGSTNPKYVRVNIAIEVGNDEVEAEFTRRLPQVRNVIIDLFNSKRPTDLVSPEGRESLKEEIQNALNGFMVSGKIKGVFGSNFALSS